MHADKNNSCHSYLSSCYIGEVGRILIRAEEMSRPPVIPELFAGKESWDEWINHFESVAEVCEWDNANKLKWLHVHLSGRASTVFRHLPDAVKADYG